MSMNLEKVFSHSIKLKYLSFGSEFYHIGNLLLRISTDCISNYVILDFKAFEMFDIKHHANPK